MFSDPTLPFADGPGSIGAFLDPALVDPSPSLLTAAIEAYREAAPALVDPDLPTLRAATSRADSSASTTDPSASTTASGASELPSLTVLVGDRAIDAVVDRFRLATRLAALADAGVCDLLALPEPQPNPALVGRATGCVLVATGDRGDGGEGGASPRETWCRVGDDPTLRERYAPLVEAAEARRLRTPSRRRVYESVRERCDGAVADDVIRAFDARVADGSVCVVGDGLENDALDLAGARCRAYVIGAYRGALDRDLRRAFEDAGLGSSATFTRIKRELREAGLLGTEPVSQPVGRPRERLLARGALAEADEPTAAVAAALEAVE